jgi:hypothetical protein
VLQGLPSAPPPSDTLRLRAIARPPAADGRIDSATWGPAQLRIATTQGLASVWLLRAADTAFVAVAVPDRSRAWADGVAVYFDIAGDRAAAPAHDDFQWSLQRVLDSSVVYRGRAGRWEAPRADPDWRLGPSREGGGWTVSSESTTSGWLLILRLDAAWLGSADPARRPAVAFRVYDDSPGGWFAWPAPKEGRQQSAVERVPDLWGSVGE